MAQTQTIDLAAIKQRQQQTWATGDFAELATTNTILGELLCEAVDIRGGQQVLDVATGSGNTAIAAARRFCEVTGIDYVPALLERARERAQAEHLSITFDVGDAESIPCPDNSFDVVLSTFGVMFAPNQEKAAQELVRVCRLGGKIGLVNHTPEGFAGHLFRLVAQYAPPPSGLKPPVLWGTEDRLRELFGDRISSLEANRRYWNQRYRSVQHWIEFWLTWYGPAIKAYETLDPDRRQQFHRDLEALLTQFNRSGDSTLVVPSEYLEVVATVRY